MLEGGRGRSLNGGTHTTASSGPPRTLQRPKQTRQLSKRSHGFACVSAEDRQAWPPRSRTMAAAKPRKRIVAQLVISPTSGDRPQELTEDPATEVAPVAAEKQRDQSAWAKEHLGAERKVFVDLTDTANKEVNWRQVRGHCWAAANAPAASCRRCCFSWRHSATAGPPSPILQCSS